MAQRTLTARPLLAALVSGAVCPATAVGAAERTAYVHAPAVSAQIMNGDRDNCVTETLAWINGPASPAPPIANPTNDQRIAHAFDLHGPKLAAAHERSCMTDRGYTQVTLTAADRKSLGRARDAGARDRWYDDFIAQDRTARTTAGPTIR